MFKVVVVWKVETGVFTCSENEIFNRVQGLCHYLYRFITKIVTNPQISKSLTPQWKKNVLNAVLDEFLCVQMVLGKHCTNTLKKRTPRHILKTIETQTIMGELVSIETISGIIVKPKRRHNYRKDNARKKAFCDDINTAAKIKGILSSTLKKQIDDLKTAEIKVLTTENCKSKSVLNRITSQTNE